MCMLPHGQLNSLIVSDGTDAAGCGEEGDGGSK